MEWRHYRAERRKEQAESTRAAILDAARRLAERGYTTTTMEAIAGAAGVATITVYATFQSKRALLAQLVDAAVSGDRAPAPIYEQERAQAIMREPDRRRQLELFAAHMAEIMERVSPLFEVMDHAAAMEPEIADLRQAMLRGRLEGMRVFVRALEDQAPLRPGLTEEEAAQTVWAVTAPQLFQLLKRDLGWESERWAAWVTETLSATLLPVGASAPQRDQVSRNDGRHDVPTIAPMVLAHRAVVRRRSEGSLPAVAFIAGYLLIWTAIGLPPLAGFPALPQPHRGP